MSGRASGPGERAAPCAARLRERGLLPLRPSAPSPRARPPLPGEEGEWSHRRHHRCRPPRSPAEGREGSAPRQDPPLGLPPPPPPLPFPSYLLSPLSLNFLRVFRTLAHDRAYWVRGPGGPYPDLYLPLTFSFSNSRPRLPSPGPPGPIILLHSRALSIAALSPAPMGE